MVQTRKGGKLDPSIGSDYDGPNEGLVTIPKTHPIISQHSVARGKRGRGNPGTATPTLPSIAPLLQAKK